MCANPEPKAAANTVRPRFLATGSVGINGTSTPWSPQLPRLPVGGGSVRRCEGPRRRDRRTEPAPTAKNRERQNPLAHPFLASDQLHPASAIADRREKIEVEEPAATLAGTDELPDLVVGNLEDKAEARNDGRHGTNAAGGWRRPGGTGAERRRAGPADREYAEGGRRPSGRRRDRRTSPAWPRGVAVPGPGSGGPLAPWVPWRREFFREAVPQVPSRREFARLRDFSTTWSDVTRVNCFRPRLAAIKLRPHAGSVRLSLGATIRPNTAPATPTRKPKAEWPI